MGIISSRTDNLLEIIKINHLRELIEGNIGTKCTDFYSFYEAVKLSDAKACIGKEMENLRRLAEQGDILAQYNLALMYYEDKGVEQNFEEAFQWIKKAANQGYAKAQYNLALMYYEGEGVEQNFEEAFQWIKKAAEQGYVPAQSQLALMYYEDKGVEQNFEEAFQWIKKSGKSRLC